MAGLFKLHFDGLKDLQEALRMLPDELVDEATANIQREAMNAASRIRANYAKHRYSGKLADSVVVVATDAGRYGVKYVVINKARHAHLFEWGTEARHSDTHDTLGRMPPGNAFVPPMEEARRRMWDEMAWMLTRHHLKVTGNAAA